MENKSEKNESKTILGDFNYAIDKMDRDGRNKTKKLYRYGFNYALLKLISDDTLKNLLLACQSSK